jgi:hypothetical protein
VMIGLSGLAIIPSLSSPTVKSRIFFNMDRGLHLSLDPLT